MNPPKLLAAFVILCAPCLGQEVWTLDFQANPGTVIQYEGTIAGWDVLGTFLYLDGSDTFPGSKKIIQAVTLANGFVGTQTNWAIGIKTLRQDYSGDFGTYTINYDTPLEVLPNKIELGRTYNTKASSTSNEGGLKVQTEYDSWATATLDKIDLGDATLEVLVVDYSMSMSSTFPGGWRESFGHGTSYWARRIGMVAQEINTTIIDSKGLHVNNKDLIYITDSNVPLDFVPVVPTYDGFGYLSDPYYYSYEEASWLYLWSQPWVFDYGTWSWKQLNHDGFFYLDFPYAYSFSSNSWIYIWPDFWVYDLTRTTNTWLN